MVSDPHFELAQKARQTGLFSILGPGTGFGDLGALSVVGKDAGSFLHAQLTNEVNALEEGQGNLTARVKRTGHLQHLFSLHRLPSSPETPPSFLLLMERSQVADLLEGLDQFLFADQVEMKDVSEEFIWCTLQGPRAPNAATRVVEDLGGVPWRDLPPQSVGGLIAGVGAPEGDGSWAIARSLTGDRGYVLGFPKSSGSAETALSVWRDACLAEEMIVLQLEDCASVLEILRIEAGWVRVSQDVVERERLLPETGLEQQAVSYNKGCYLGQEVIARVRTYGSLPFGLRGVVLEIGKENGQGQEILAELPEAGAEAQLEDGTAVGQFVSRTFSPVLEAPVVMAYLDRGHRTPGTELVFRGRSGVVRGKVALLPFYHAPDGKERVEFLYDRAVRIFSEGEESKALELLEEALRLDPGFSDGYEAIGVILGRSQRFHEAIDMFKRLEEVAPHEPIVNTNLSLYYMKLGDKVTAETEAGKAMQKSLALGQGDEDSAAEIVAEQERARLADAERKSEMFRQVLEIDAEDGVALFGLGTALSTLGQWEEAESFFSRASEVDRSNSAVYLAWGKVLEARGRNDRAGEVYRQGMEVASKKGDLMPLKEMEHRILLLRGGAVAGETPRES